MCILPLFKIAGWQHGHGILKIFPSIVGETVFFQSSYPPGVPECDFIWKPGLHRWKFMIQIFCLADVKIRLFVLDQGGSQILWHMPLKEEVARRHTQERRSCDNSGLGWPNRKSETVRNSGSHHKQGKGREGFFPRVFRGRTSVPKTGMQISRLQKCERINFCCNSYRKIIYGMILIHGQVP